VSWVDSKVGGFVSANVHHKVAGAQFNEDRYCANLALQIGSQKSIQA
jgi:hypothetical protein